MTNETTDYDAPLVSIVIPSFNREHCIGRAIRSVLDQTYRNWELIVVDNYSSDNTIEIVESFLDDRIFVTKIANLGIVAKSRNVGIEMSNGSFIAFLDSDDWWLPSKLQLSVDVLRAGHDLVHHDLFKVNALSDRGNRLRVLRNRQLSWNVFDDLLYSGNAINNSSVVVRKSILELTNGFSERRDLIGSEDYDLWLRLARHTPQFKRIDTVLGYYWNGGGNLSSARLTYRCNASLRRRYRSDFIRLFGTSMPGWMLYSSARALVSLERFSLGRKLACKALKARLPLLTKLKALTVWFLAVMKQKL